MSAAKEIVVHLPDTRGVVISPYGSGNLKLGFGVYTYSRPPGLPSATPLGGVLGLPLAFSHGTCPGATQECQAICYARRPMAEQGAVAQMWHRNAGPRVPPIPADCRVLRIHVSGDFDTPEYIDAWIARLTERPDVTAWAYTRSWRVPALLGKLEVLRALPNLQLFASMDTSTEEVPPLGWRRAWITEGRLYATAPDEGRLSPVDPDAEVLSCDTDNWIATTVHSLDKDEAVVSQTPSYTCPEETGRKRDCLACGYCFEGKKHDVTFLEH